MRRFITSTLAVLGVFALAACSSGGYSGPIYSPEGPLEPHDSREIAYCVDTVTEVCEVEVNDDGEFIIPKVVGAGPEFHRTFSGYDVTQDPLYIQDYEDEVNIYLPAFLEMCERQPELRGGICPE